MQAGRTRGTKERAAPLHLKNRPGGAGSPAHPIQCPSRSLLEKLVWIFPNEFILSIILPFRMNYASVIFSQFAHEFFILLVVSNIHPLIVSLSLSCLLNAFFGVGRIHPTAKFNVVLKTPMIHIAV